MPAHILHVLQHIFILLFLRDRVNVLNWPAVQICLQLKMYDQSWKGESDNDDHRLLSFWSLVSSETGQKICLQNFNN